MHFSKAEIAGLERAGKLLFGRTLPAKDVVQLVFARLVERPELEQLSLASGAPTQPVLERQKRECGICGKPLTGRQRDWCSKAHKVAGHRRRKRGG